MVFLTLLAAIITADKTKKAPRLEAIAKDQFEKENVAKTPPKREAPKIRSATPKLAPEEIPKTKGPASGFLNNVCIKRPLIDKPEPTKTAVMAFGILKFKIIVCQLSLVAEPPESIFKISSIGMVTDPKLMFAKNRITSKPDKTINCFLYDFCSINFRNFLKS